MFTNSSQLYVTIKILEIGKSEQDGINGGKRLGTPVLTRVLSAVLS